MKIDFIKTIQDAYSWFQKEVGQKIESCKNHLEEYFKDKIEVNTPFPDDADILGGGHNEDYTGKKTVAGAENKELNKIAKASQKDTGNKYNKIA